MKNTARMTIRDLVTAIQDCTGSDEEVVAVIDHLVRSRRLRRFVPAPLPVA